MKKEYNENIQEETSPLEEQTRETRREQREQKDLPRRRAIRQTAPFVTALALVTVIAWLVPLRPTVSDAEKRELKSFPEFSVSALMSGSYFHDIDAWFTDTFTFREFWMTRTQEFKSLYGLQSVAVYGDIVTNDTVPVVPQVTAAPQTPAQPDGIEVEAIATPVPTPVPTPEPTPVPWGGEMIGEDDYVGQGAVLQIGDSAYKITNFSQYYADRYVEYMNAAVERLDGKANLYCMIVPENTSFMLQAKDREKYGCVLEEDVLAYMYNSMSDKIKKVSVLDNLIAHNGEYVAFRTDHHWTALGAYYAYEEWCKVAGVEPVPLSEYREVEWPGFLGTYYYKANQSHLMGKNPDTVFAYEPPGDVHMYLAFGGEDDWGMEHTLLIDRTHSSSGGMYMTFLGSDSAKVTFVNNDITDGSACLVVKTSVGNPYVYYMTQHYQYVYVVDVRHYFTRTMVDFVEKFDVDDVIFVHGTGIAQTDGGTGLVSWFTR